MPAILAQRISPVKRNRSIPVRQRTWFGALARIVALTGVMALFVPLWAVAAGPQAATGPQLESNFVRLAFSNPDDIARLDKKIDFGNSGGWFASSTPAAVEERLMRKIDAIYDKVQRILDMRKPMQPKVLLRVAHDDDELAAIFMQIFKRKGSARAWYIYEYNTVYINASDVNEGMIAHEFAHSIVDHYLSVRPPRASAEILATYVDKYLFDDVKSRNDFQ